MSGTVEVDEVYIGAKPRHGYKLKRGPTGIEHYSARKSSVIGMLPRGGEVRTAIVKRVDANTVGPLLAQHINAGDGVLHTDGALIYKSLGRRYKDHQSVDHSRGEYVRGDVTTNRIEGFFGLIRRGLHGIYHSVSPEHLNRYLSEFEWRFNHRNLTDSERVAAAVRAANGKRLMYRPPAKKEGAA
jgi:transposase-like protein